MRLAVGLSCCFALMVAAPVAAQTARRDALAPPRLIGFGSALALSNNRIFVGRPSESPGFPMPPSDVGGVHIFTRGADGSWTETGHVNGSDATTGDGFGSALAVDGNVLVVGAAKRDSSEGAAYVFEQRGQAWTQTARLSAPDGSIGDAFGTAVAVAGDIVLVGAPGRNEEEGVVFVFRRGGDGWIAADSLVDPGAVPQGRVGGAIAFDGQRAVIGAPGPSPLGALFGEQPKLQVGRVLVYRVRAGAWDTPTVLQVPAADSARALGLAVALDQDALFASAPATHDAVGAVYRFPAAGGGTWGMGQSLTPDSLGNFALFGVALAAVGGDVIVGSPFGEHGNGVAMVLRQGRAGWAVVQRITIEPFAMMPAFAWAIAGAGDLAVIGAPGNDFFEGSGFVYRRQGNEWREAGKLVDATSGFTAVTGGEVNCRRGRARAFTCADVDLQSFLPVSALGGTRGIMLNDIWGWTDPQTGHEYALVGKFDGTAFVDVTDAVNPIYLGSLPKTDSAHVNAWRDIKTYGNYAFIVSDGAGPHGMQVFDLTKLRNVKSPPVTFTEDAHYSRIHSAHNIAINTETGFAYAVGSSMGGETCGGALHMIDIRDPLHPTFAGCFADPNTGMAKTGYTHDAQCVTYTGPDKDYQGHEICFDASENALGIADVTDKANPKAIASASYPNVAYSHQGWLSEDQRYFYLDDEGDELAGTVPRTRTLVWDVEDLDDPIVATEFLGTTAASDHNLYVKGHYVYESDYVAGLRILDISNPVQPREVGYFDTVPGGDNVPGFAGSWSNYPFFKSGTIILTSMREGLFVVKFRPQRPVP